LGTTQAFKNIEADGYYDGPVKLETMKEFELGLVLLKNQAEGLGMDVRAKDIEMLRLHMHGKALLKGECFDRAITLQRTSSKKVNVPDYMRTCVDGYLNYKPAPAKVSTPRFAWCDVWNRYRWREENRPYPFLGFTVPSPNTPDYIGIKTCYEDSR
jgi:hypothetical protein